MLVLQWLMPRCALVETRSPLPHVSGLSQLKVSGLHKEIVR